MNTGGLRASPCRELWSPWLGARKPSGTCLAEAWEARRQPMQKRKGVRWGEQHVKSGSAYWWSEGRNRGGRVKEDARERTDN